MLVIHHDDCELVWEFLMRCPAPEIVRLIGDYDCWRLKETPQCFAIYEGMKLQNTQPDSRTWGWLLDEEDDELFTQIHNDGQACILYRDAYCKSLRDAYGYECELDGLRGYATNVMRFGSAGFGAMMDIYDYCLSFIFDGSKFSVSLYSTKIDVSPIAKNHGGGGHKGASGFITDSIIWKKVEGSQKV